jgi:UDP-N-acetylglucosamine 4-epimerase
VTGTAGFIGSHLAEALLSLGQDVAGLDNLSTGFAHNLEALERAAGSRGRFHFFRGDVRDKEVCREACKGVRVVLHHAAFVSVPASMADPVAAHATNVDGFFNMLEAARENGVRRFIYASSSAVYGDAAELPLREEHANRPLLSPYAVTKKINELYAEAWGKIYGLNCTGLRYFNVFGPRQDPESPYAAVIPRWIDALSHGLPVPVYGDGEQTRDFCYVKNVVRANLLAALAEKAGVYNIACGVETTLNELFRILKQNTAPDSNCRPVYEEPRAGDIVRSFASVERARLLLGYEPLYSLEEGLAEMCAAWRSENGKP